MSSEWPVVVVSYAFQIIIVAAGREPSQPLILEHIVGLASIYRSDGSCVTLLSFGGFGISAKKGAYGAYLLSYAGSSFTYSICTSNRDTPTLREPEHPEKKTPTRPMPLCRNKAENTQRRCRRLLFVTEREKDVSTTGVSFTLPHRT